MRKPLSILFPLALGLLCLTGCSPIGEKDASLSLIYGAAAFLSLLLLIGYVAIARKRNNWYLLLFASVLVVNIGYFALSVSGSLNTALWANRLSYLGSVFLPLSMWMIILHTTHISIPKWLPALLLALAAVVFLIAATPGYLPIYYKEVSFTIVNGAATLDKVYGPLHCVYLVYLLGYFAAMIATILYASLKNKIDSLAYALMIAIAVFVNIGVWLIEQLVYIPFEMLSISYIISESFLLGLHILVAEDEKSKDRPELVPNIIPAPETAVIPPPEAPQVLANLTQEDQERLDQFLSGLGCLTPKEQELFECYVSGLTTDVILERLNIKENTLKFHSKNLYGKLGVKSRKQLMELHHQISRQNQ